MEKIKNTVKVKITLIFLIFFLLILFLNNESNATRYGSVSNLLDSGYAKDGLKIGDKVNAEGIDDVFKNNSVYCIEAGQDYPQYGGYEYTLKEIIDVNSTTNKSFQPLLYIFKNYPKSSFQSSSATMPYFNNASQIALWGTIKAKDLHRTDSNFAVDNCRIENRTSGYDSIYTYYAPSVGGGDYYDVQRPYFAIYTGTASRPRYYGVASYQTSFPSGLGVTGSSYTREKRAAHLAYKIYEKATEATAQKYEGKIYVFSSPDSQNFIIFSKPNPDDTKPTITLNLYKKDAGGTKRKEAIVKISRNDNIETINGRTSEITVTSKPGSGKFNGNDSIKIVPKDNTGTVKINLRETDAPEKCIPMEDTVILTISYDKTTGEITGIKENNTTKYFDYKSATEIDFINPKVPEWYIYKVNQDNNAVKKEVTFDTTIAIKGGKTYTGTYKTKLSTGKTGNIISEAAQKEFAQKYMNNKTNVTAKVTIKEQKVQGYGDPVTCSFTLTYNGTKLTASGLDNTQKCKNNNTSTTITIKNIEIKPIWVTVKKVDNNNKGIGAAKFKISFTQDKTTTTDYLVIPKTGGKYYDTSTFSPNSYNVINVKIEETEGPEHFNKSTKPVELQFKWNGTEENGKWEPTITSGEEQLVEFTDSEFSDLSTNKYYPSNSKRLIRTDKTADRDFNRSFGLKIKNDPRIIKGTKLYKYDKTGKNAVQGATFTAEFNGVTYVKINGNKINATGNKVTVTGLVSDSSGLIANIQEIEALENSDTVYMTVTETKSVSGFSILPEPVNLVFKYDKKDSSGGKWKLYEDTENNELPSEFFEVKNDELILNIKDDCKLDKLTILKTDSLYGSKVQGAKFNVTLGNVKSVKGYSINSSGTTTLTGVTTNANGNIELEDVVIKDITEPITITMEETSAPEGYKKIEGKVTVKLKRDGNAYKITEQTKDSTVLDSEFKVGNATVSGNTVSIGIKDIPAIEELEFLKNDSLDNGDITGAEFKVDFINVQSYYVNGVKKTDTSTTVTVTEGESLLEKIILADASKSATITLEEIKAPEGYKKIDGKIYLTVKYTDDGYVITADKDSTVLDGEFNLDNPINVISKNEFEVNIKDIPALQELNLFKLDSQDNSNFLTGAEFKVDFDNVQSYYVNGDEKTDTSTTVTVDEGKPLIEKILLEDINEPATITLEETNAPIGYKKLVGKIYLTVEYTDAGYRIEATKDETISNKEFNIADVEITTNKKNANVTIKDIPVMNLGGIVWEDGQKGVKNVELPNGRKDEDTGIAGVKVTLYKEGEDDPITKDMYGNELMTKTASAGDTLEYKMYNGQTDTITLEEGEYIFPNLERGTNYYVVFTYDGINYQTTELSGDLYKDNNESKVTEVSRDAFNAKFQTITDSPTTDTNDNSYAKANGVSDDLVYEYVGEENGVERSKLITTDSDGNVLDNYKMTAKSEKYLRDVADWKETWTNDGKIEKNHYAIDINCGLLKRYFDLAIGMDIESAKLTINDKETKYSYNQILDGALDKEITVEKLLEKVQDNSELEYNLYLYSSDYNYRIDDYIMNATEKKDVTEASVDNATEDAEVIISNTDSDKELRAFVTYKVVLMNQSTINSAQINKLAYYYDENFNFVSVGRAVDETGIAINGEGINFDTNAELDSLEGKKSAEVTGFAQELKSPDYRQVLYFTFEIIKSDDGTRTLPKDITCANIVEILSYSTDEGLIDSDSCPGNAAIAYGNAAIAYEDDTDEAPGLNIKVTKNGRTITGTVFEDLDKNGENNDNKPVNDVIVQLIEVKKIEGIEGKYYEYIWQETRSGSDTVKITNRNGYPNSYTVSKQDGQYQFTDFIPGNYIIRFIYGDGRVYDITDSVKTYNGQDYQSTVDNNYKEEWYNTSNYSNNSVARDNEARRLKVMSYSTTIDWKTGIALETCNKEFSQLTDIEKQNLKEYYNNKLFNDTSYHTVIKNTYKNNNGEEYGDITQVEEMTEKEYKLIKYYVLQNTWMCAETSKINIPVDAENISTKYPNTEVSFEFIDNTITLGDMNFGLIKRPETKLVLEKHITGLKITPTGTGVQPIVDAKLKNIVDILNKNAIEQGDLTGITTGLSTIKSNRDERGFWKVETDIEELAQGATLEVEYTYVIKNESDVDYLSTYLVGEYKDNPDNYSNILIEKSKEMKTAMREGTYSYSYSTDNIIGMYLGQYYYTKNEDVAKTSDDESPVLSRVDTVEDYIENQMKLDSETNFRKSNTVSAEKNMYDTDGTFVENGLNIETVIQNKEKFDFLRAKANEEEYKEEYKDENTDYTKTVSLTTTLAASNKEITYPGYIAQIMQYSNAAGRRDMDACPGNLNYIHSEDNEITLNSYVQYDEIGNVSKIYDETKETEAPEALGYVRINEDDEYWGCGGEKIMVTKPTGEDKQETLQIAIIAISSIAVLGVGIVLIKKFVLKK